MTLWGFPGGPVVRNLPCKARGVKALVAQLCPILYDRMDCRLPGPTVHGVLKARHWRGQPLPFLGDELPDPETGPRPPALQADCLPSGPPGKPQTFTFEKGRPAQSRNSEGTESCQSSPWSGKMLRASGPRSPRSTATGACIPDTVLPETDVRGP